MVLLCNFWKRFIHTQYCIVITISIIIQITTKYERLYFFLLSILGDTRIETQFLRANANHTMLTTPTHGTSCGVSDLKSSLPVETQTDLLWSDPKNPAVFSKTSNSQDQLSFQKPQILRTSYSGYEFNHPLKSPQQPSSFIFCLGVYYDRWCLSYPFPVGVRVPI